MQLTTIQTKIFPVHIYRSERMTKTVRKRGFTLIELLVVVAIAAILLAIALPNLQPQVASANAKSVATKMADALQFARQYALNTSNLVTYTPNGCNYSVATQQGTQLLAGPSSVPSGVACQPMAQVLFFLGDGSVALCSQGSQGLSCNAPTGTISSAVAGGGSTWQISVSPGGVISTSVL